MAQAAMSSAQVRQDFATMVASARPGERPIDALLEDDNADVLPAFAPTGAAMWSQSHLPPSSQLPAAQRSWPHTPGCGGWSSSPPGFVPSKAASTSLEPQLSRSFGQQAAPGYASQIFRAPPTQQSPPMQYAAPPPEQSPPEAYRFVDKPKHDFATAMLHEHTMRSFALTLTLFLCIVFAVPIMATYNLGRDPQVKYWITKHTWVILILPLLFAGAHMAHVARGRPSRVMAVLCTIGSCALLLFFADVVLMNASQIASVMKANDCSTFEQKRILEDEWQSASAFYDKCMKSTAAYLNKTVAVASENYRIQDCTGYEEQLRKHPDWAYLAITEEQHLCSGWCTVGEPLWTFLHTKDSCSTVLGQHMVETVQRTMWKITTYTLICFICASATLLAVTSFLLRNGIEW